MSYNFVPAGYESSGSDEDFDGYYENRVKTPKKIIEKPALELMKDRLMQQVKADDLNGIKNELDHGVVKGFNIDDQLDNRWNLLYHACFLARSSIAKFLIEERGACTNLTEESETPLIVACYSEGDSEEVLKIVKLLIKESTIISSSNSAGITALMFASSRGHIEVVRYLLSLNDAYDAIDNEGKNALFHAIDGKQVEIAKVLLGAGIDLSVVNQFGCTAKQYAVDENQVEIAELFPPEVYRYETPGSFLSYNRFEDLIPSSKSDVPAYFSDVVTLLRSMNCDKFISNFAQENVTLEEFLTISDERLKEIGIEYPFERNIIKLGLHTFHNAHWGKQSLFIPNFEKEINSLDLIMVLANITRQMVIIKSHILYMQQLGKKFDLHDAYDYFTLDSLEEFQENGKILKRKILKIAPKKKPKNPLLIEKKPFKGFIKIATIAAVPFTLFVAFKLFKK